MSRNLDSSLAAALGNGAIVPAVLVDLTLKSGVEHIWSGVGDLVWNGNTYKGVGALGGISAITEGSEVRADGMTLRLSGIGGTTLAGTSEAPAGLAPPVAIAPGQYVAWSTPQLVAIHDEPGYGSIAAELNGATINRTENNPGDVLGIRATWSNFLIPDMPEDAVIVALYPTVVLDCTAGPADPLNDFGAPIGAADTPYSGQYHATLSSPSLATLQAASVFASLTCSLGTPPFDQTLVATSPSIAVYYTSASNLYAATSEALGDVQLGASAKVYFGLMSGGAFIGSPYLAFSGQVDQPTVETGSQTSSITLALENRLSNLARPSGRRYTAADQKLFYPDDSAFDWVETLNDRADRWGG